MPIILVIVFLFFFNIELCADIPSKMAQSNAFVHIIGDSHSRSFSAIERCIVHWLGPITMHRVGRDGLSILNFKQLGVKELDAVVLCFGEIDIRVHIGKQRDLHNRELDEIIDKLVNGYLKTIQDNLKLYDNIYVIVFLPVPPTDSSFNPAYPFYGTIQDRVFITRCLSNHLQNICLEENIGIIDPSDFYSTKFGDLDTQYSDGSVHIHSSHSYEIHNQLYRLLFNFYR